MPNKQKMQNYDYFDILDFKDRPVIFWIAIRPQDRDPFNFANSNTIRSIKHPVIQEI